MMELGENGIAPRRQIEIPAFYRGRDLGAGFRADIIVVDSLLLELKSIDTFAPIHTAIMINYLPGLRIKRGFFLNCNVRLLKHGIKRISI